MTTTIDPENLIIVRDIIASWGDYDSVAATAANGVSDEDLATIRELCEDRHLDADQVAKDLLAVCRERVAEQQATQCFAIRSQFVGVGGNHSTLNGAEWYNVAAGWTPAKDEATQFETLADAELIVARNGLSDCAVVVKI